MNTDKQIIQIGNICPTRTRANPNQGRVYDPQGISPSLNCKGGATWNRIFLMKIFGFANTHLWNVSD